MTGRTKLLMLLILAGIAGTVNQRPLLGEHGNDNKCDEINPEVEGQPSIMHHFRGSGACYVPDSKGTMNAEHLTAPHYSSMEGACYHAHQACAN
jgi:hypothetical protein